MASLTQQITRLEKKLVEMARFDDPGMFFRLKAVPGIGDILALVILYEIGKLSRFRGHEVYPLFGILAQSGARLSDSLLECPFG